MIPNELKKLEIKHPSKEIYRQIKLNWDHIAKPLDGLGEFETLLCRIGAAQEKTMPAIQKRAVVMMIADNGIVAEGVSQSGREVTLAVARAMGQQSSSVGKMAKVCNADCFPVDIGICSKEEIPGVLDQKVAMGTQDFLKQPAMSKQQAIDGIFVGIRMVERLLKQDYTIIATGEMGIGNTTTSTALAASLLGKFCPEMAGRGAGLSDAGLSRKIAVIEQALDQYDLLYASPFDALCAVGGLDIAGLCGIFIGGAIYGIPIVIDGIISATAALLAERMIPGVRAFCIPSHSGKEPVMEQLLKALEITPVIGGNMALGEGTGAVMLFPLLDMAMALYSDGKVFEEIDVRQYEREHAQ